MQEESNVRSFPTIAAALAQAKPKDTIVLLDPIWEEGPIRISGRGKSALNDVTIEAGDNVPRGTKFTIELPC